MMLLTCCSSSSFCYGDEEPGRLQLDACCCLLLITHAKNIPFFPPLAPRSWIDVRSVSQDSPADFKLQGSSDNGATWTTVASIEGETGWGIAEDRTYLVPEGPDGAVAGPFLKYRLLVR